MGLKDRHDKRLFTHYVKVAEDGSVAAIIEVADGAPAPRDAENAAYVDVTAVRRAKLPIDLYALAVDLPSRQAARMVLDGQPAPPPLDMAQEFRDVVNAAVAAAASDEIVIAVDGRQ